MNINILVTPSKEAYLFYYNKNYFDRKHLIVTVSCRTAEKRGYLAKWETLLAIEIDILYSANCNKKETAIYRSLNISCLISHCATLKTKLVLFLF